MLHCKHSTSSSPLRNSACSFLTDVRTRAALCCIVLHYAALADITVSWQSIPVHCLSRRAHHACSSIFGVYIYTHIYIYMLIYIYICILFCTKICMREIDVLRAARSNNAVSSASCMVNCGSWHLHAGTRYTTSSEALKAKVGLSILCTRTWDYTAFHSSTIWLVCGKTLT